MQNYYYVELHLLEDFDQLSNIESVALAQFSSTGIEDFSIEEEKVDEILGERSYSGADIPVSVIEEVEFTISSENENAKKIFFSSHSEAKLFCDYLEGLKGISFKVIEKPVEDWNEKWRESYKPIIVSPDFEIIPSWFKEEYKTTARYKLYIYPGMGFGTGSHETTFLCMQLMLKTKSFSPGVQCLDFGCGSGILGLGLKLLQDDCTLDLYDIDQEALDNCIQNIELNNFSQKNINLLLPKQRIKIEKKYEIVFANILKNVLELEIEFLTNAVKDNGFLILSGLLKEQEEDILKQYLEANKNLSLIEVARSGDWIAILLKNQ